MFRDFIEPELLLMVRILKPGGTVIDIGANVGVYSLSAAHAVGPSGTVIAVEPFPEVLAELSANITLNRPNSNGIRMRCMCMSGSTEPGTLWLNAGRPHSFSLTRAGSVEGLSVLKVSLDDLCRWDSVASLDYLKIDAEGEEERILGGAPKSIKSFRPVIQMEGTKKALPEWMENYLRFRKTGLNCVLVPAEKKDVAEVALEMGWKQI